MRRFLFTTLVSNDLGLLTRSLPIAQELRLRGHQVAFCNPAIAPRRVIFDAGFDNLPYEGPLHAILSGDGGMSTLYRLLRSRHVRRDLGYLAYMVKLTKQFGTSEVWDIDHFSFLTGTDHPGLLRGAVEAFVSAISRYDPDAVVDFWNPAACIAARVCRKPLVAVIQADMHPLSRGFIWWKTPPASVPSPVPTINLILKEHGLRPITRTGDLFLGDKTLVVGTPETDPLPDEADVTYVGAILWQQTHEPPPRWLAELDTGTPVVWLYPGTARYFRGSPGWADSLVVATSCIEALSRKRVQVILSTGHRPLPRQARKLPPHFRHVPFVPSLMMAARSDVMIHHGGYGSCQTGLAAGTPSLIIPTMSERESNARRIAAVGAGAFVLPTADASGRRKRVDTAAVSAALDRLLTDETYRECARAMRDRLKNFGGPAYAAELLEHVVEPSRRSQRDSHAADHQRHFSRH